MLLRGDPSEPVPSAYAETYELLSLVSAGFLTFSLDELDRLPDRIIRQINEIRQLQGEVEERHQELEAAKRKGEK